MFASGADGQTETGTLAARLLAAGGARATLRLSVMRDLREHNIRSAVARDVDR
jgi:hypothetical protein